MSVRSKEESKENVEARKPFKAKWSWKAGAVSGFSATVVMGIAITLVDISVLKNSISGLYALEGNLLVGWIAHLFHGTLFGLLFAAVLSDPGLYKVSESEWKTIVAGVLFGVTLGLGGAGLIMPIWLSAVGFSTPPALPNITTALLAWHIIYGAVLGATFSVLDRGDSLLDTSEVEMI